MALFRDYLRDHAKFYCPPVDSHQTESSALRDVEVEQALALWDAHRAVVEARRDTQMVDALIDVLDEELGEDSAPKNINGWLEQKYDEDMQRTRVIRTESDVRSCVDRGPLNVFELIMISLDNPVEVGNVTDIGSKLDYVLSTAEGKKALVKLKAPSIIDLAAEELSELSNDEVGFNVPLDSQSLETGMKVIAKACVHMILYRAEWLALTCFTKWVFLRLHSRGTGEAPYITYSTIERQLDNTRPFCALLGMMLAYSRDISVPSNADMNGQLRPVPVTKAEPRVNHYSRKRGSSPSSSSGYLITWSPKAMPNKRWLEFHAVDTDPFPALGKDTIRLCVHRNIGHGSTGVVFEAIPEGDEHNGAIERRSYAIKTVGKGETLEEQSCAQRLFNELEIYRHIEQTSPASVKIVPQCYGLFEINRTRALVMGYEGNVLRHDGEWSELSLADRKELFNVISTLHGLGVYHDVLEPRNVARVGDRSFRIIDFTSSKLHDCHPETCAELDHIKTLFGLQQRDGQSPDRPDSSVIHHRGNFRPMALNSSRELLHLALFCIDNLLFARRPGLIQNRPIFKRHCGQSSLFRRLTQLLR
ncbi:uncharacterized protein FOMMEDRAFT_150779 [Fomitiporia mediterranea MF3/22]|uniref:uncharacterized protein n=1 Tax=Fomitiporia mediterranea (strain MF3/22) TaxID=694068 RepID=UPI0004407DCB|nr:uncharacterized protein FOMMEDRAFT_150779 [Fomitiporia mediterranea MF3/22]EJD08100.1 hypothetical protein FOMMEDRAFT_150779 [Fomitiporia mediterranea MF3/22]